MSWAGALPLAVYIVVGLQILQQASSINGNELSIEGRVTKRGTTEPIEGARVRFTPRSGRALTVLSGTDGRFVAKDLAPGNYVIVATRQGFVSPRHPPLRLTLSNPIRDYEVQLTPTAVITGFISSRDGSPRVGVRVQAMQTQYVEGREVLATSKTAISDDQGLFRLSELEPGDYVIRVLESMFAPRFYPGTRDPRLAIPVSLTAGALVSGIRFTLDQEELFDIHLRVRTDIGTGSPEFFVVPRYQGDRIAAATPFRKTEQEHYIASGFAPGSYDIYVSASFAGTDGPIRMYGRTDLEIVDRNIDEKDVALIPNVSVEGRIIEVNALSLQEQSGSEMRINLRPLDGMEIVLPTKTTRPDQNGVFAFSNVAMGRYAVSVDGLPPDAYVSSIRYGNREVRDMLLLELPSTERLDVFVAGNGGVIAGVVRNLAEQPEPDSHVALFAASSSRAYKITTTDESGEFTFRGVAPGEYRVLAWEPADRGSHENPAMVSKLENAAARVKVGSRTTERINLRAFPAASR